MFDTLIEYFKNISKSRIIYLVIAYLLLALTLVYTVFTIQVVRKEEIVKEQPPNEIITRETKATRGNIYDANGVLLAYNKLSYNVTLAKMKVFETNDELNDMIYKLIRIIEVNGGKLSPYFYIEKNKKGKLVFTVKDASELRFKRDAYKLKSIEELSIDQKKASAEEVYEHLRQGKYMFGISDKYDMDETLKIMKIRFALLLNTYSRNPINVATNVNEKTVAAIKEYSSSLPGVEVAGHTYRVYNESKYFSHILGYTGNINDTELSEDKEKYYTASDQIGKTGLEYSFESILRGVKGEEEVTINPNFDVADIKVVSEPKPGDDIYLTVDSKLQKACYHILEKDLATVLLSRIHNSSSAGEKGTNASKIMIPIFDVYYAFFNNNIVDFQSLSGKDSTDIEKKIYAKFQNHQKGVLKKLKEILSVKSTVTKKEAGEDLANYLDYFYSFLTEEELLYPKQMSSDDPVLKAYLNDEKSLSELIKHFISKKLVNLDALGVGDAYLSTEEIFDRIIRELFSSMNSDTNFFKMIYKSLIYNNVVTGSEIGLLLYDQGYFKKDSATYDKLFRGELSAYGFIRSKIKSLEIKPSDLALDPCSGSLVVTEAKTGKIKAMVTYPSYDNNKLANQINFDYYTKLQSDLSFPLINRPTQQKTAPGSTFKPISGFAFLDLGISTPSETVRDEVVFEKTDKPAKCWSRISHGNVNFVNAMEVSCNYYFYEMGYRMSLDNDGKYNSRLGLSKLNHYAELFGIKSGETSGVELYEYEPSISDTDSVRSSIGQGSYALTPTQIARFMSGIANGGTLNYLTLIDEIKSLDGKKVKNTISKSKTEQAPKLTFKPEYWTAIHKGLYDVINGRNTSFPGMFEKANVIAAGKSGTAEFSELRGNHALFTSYAPYDNPELCVTAVLPFAYVSSNAAMVCADFYEYYYGEKDTESIVNKDAEERNNVINSD